MQPPDMDKKREAFLEHLKQKYPHHASAIMGHQERLREQSRSPKHGPPSQPCGGDQVDHLSLASLESLDAMSEVEAPTAFTRGSRVRASLPVVRSTNQTKDRSLGVLYLQYGDETKQIRMPNEITSVDTVRALFVSAFPQQLTMKMLESPSMAVYVKDDMRNVYYELSDVRNITDHSCLKVYHKDPAQAFSHGPRPPPNTDARVSGSTSSVHNLQQPPLGPPPHHPVQGGGVPPSPHSMPPSPSRIPFGPRPGSIPGSSTLPRERLAAANPSVRSVSPCPSAILERRDVKPDEDLGGKSHTLTRGGEALYADPYLLQEGRMSITSAHGPHSGGSPVMAPKTNAVQSETGSLPVKVNLLHFRKNVSDLRLQLHQMRQLQLQNQEALRAQLKRAEQEISVKLSEAMRRQDDPVQRQRTLVEEDRHKYLGLEERVLEQLSDLEQYVSSLQRDATSTQRTVTLKDVEDGALTLRKVGESLAGLKGEFPALQTRMRAVLRVEVEAVKFLKEEPHKLDSMLKRVRTLTETLGSLRRRPCVCVCVTFTEPSPPAPLDHQNSTVRSEVMPSSPVVIHQVRSSPVNLQQSQQSAALTSQPIKGQDRESAKGVSLDPPSPVHQKKTHGILKNNGTQVLVMEELQSHPDKSKSRALSIEAAEKEWEEKRQNLGFYNGKEFEKILQEAQVNMMKGIPNLEIVENTAAPPAVIDPPSEDPDSKPVKKLPEKPPKPAVEKPLKPASKPPSPDVFTKHFSEKSSRSPPPPPPRKTYPSSNSGMTTTRSGAVVYTSRKESSSEEEEEVAPPTPQPRPGKVPPETRPKPTTPPPVAPATREEEDEGDKMMAELQVFQKCTVKDGGVETTTPVEPQIRELRPGPLLPPKQKKVHSNCPCSCPANCLPPSACPHCVGDFTQT
uniref:Si:ch211-285f17.1 n=1 Tax=Cynoglossus semilaevis TaxID=244447 RepID=A0A3P8UE48_CYNSE